MKAKILLYFSYSSQCLAQYLEHNKSNYNKILTFKTAFTYMLSQFLLRNFPDNSTVPSFHGQLRVQHGLQTIAKALEKCLHGLTVEFSEPWYVSRSHGKPKLSCSNLHKDAAAGPQLLCPRRHFCPQWASPQYKSIK